MKRACDVCGRDFESTRNSKRCSIECRKLHEKTRTKLFFQNNKPPPVISNCVICKSSFRKFGAAITCSEKCRKVRKRERDARVPVIAECDICGSEFRKLGTSKRCSEECKRLNKNKYARGYSKKESYTKWRRKNRQANRERIIKLNRQLKEKYPERYREYSKKYYQLNPEKFRKRSRESQKQSVESLSDRYIRQLLELPAGEGDEKLIELKRQLVKLRRVLKQKSKETTGKENQNG